MVGADHSLCGMRHAFCHFDYRGGNLYTYSVYTTSCRGRSMNKTLLFSSKTIPMLTHQGREGLFGLEPLES